MIKKSLSLGISTAACTLTSSVTRADVIAYWNFNEGSGQTVHDATGNGNTGTLENGTSWTKDSLSGYALRFDGLDDRVRVDRTPSMRLTGNLTIEASIKRDSFQDGTIFSCNGPFFMGIRNNHIYGGVYNTENTTDGWMHIEGTRELELNRWYRLSLTYDGSFIKGLIDGIQDVATLTSGTRNPDRFAYQPWIGWGEPGHDRYFHGTIDNLAIHDVAIPSPSSFSLLGVGLLAGRRRRR